MACFEYSEKFTPSMVPPSMVQVAPSGKLLPVLIWSTMFASSVLVLVIGFARRRPRTGLTARTNRALAYATQGFAGRHIRSTRDYSWPRASLHE